MSRGIVNRRTFCKIVVFLPNGSNLHFFSNPGTTTATIAAPATNTTTTDSGARNCTRETSSKEEDICAKATKCQCRQWWGDDKKTTNVKPNTAIRSVRLLRQFNLFSIENTQTRKNHCHSVWMIFFCNHRCILYNVWNKFHWIHS